MFRFENKSKYPVCDIIILSISAETETIMTYEQINRMDDQNKSKNPSTSTLNSNCTYKLLKLILISPSPFAYFFKFSINYFDSGMKPSRVSNSISSFNAPSCGLTPPTIWLTPSLLNSFWELLKEASKLICWISIINNETNFYCSS